MMQDIKEDTKQYLTDKILSNFHTKEEEKDDLI